MFIFYSTDNPHQRARLGLSVPARKVRKATQRNTVKRMVRETFRHKRLQLPNRDYVVIYKGSNPPGRQALQQALNAFWDKEISTA